LRLSSNRRSGAFFDIDGTLLRGFIIQEFPRFLVTEGFIEPVFPDQIDKAISSYYSGAASYREIAEVIPRLYASALEGRGVDDVKELAKRFIEVYLPQRILPYSKPLIRSVSELVDVTIAVSGSPIEVVEELEELGFDKIYGSIFENKSGIYTGRVIINLILGEEKAELVRRVAEELKVDLSKSLAFGDTDQDAPLLSLVGLPIAINPNRKLREICKSKGWRWLDKEDLQDLEKVTEWLEDKIRSL